MTDYDYDMVNQPSHYKSHPSGIECIQIVEHMTFNLGNAVKYTQSGDVVVRVGEGAVEVVDSGPGLSAEDAARLFERGYRGTHAGHSQGGGIGLSIVRRLCALYGWDVRVRPGETQGVVATLSFA